MFKGCLSLSFFRNLKKNRKNVGAGAVVESSDKTTPKPAVLEAKTAASKETIHSKESSSSTLFVESHPLPDSLKSCGREATRLEGDLVHASAFFEALFRNEEEISFVYLVPRLRDLGFSDIEAEAFAEILKQYLLVRCDKSFSLANVLPFLAFYLEKAKKTESIIEFGFQVLDQNSDGYLSPFELAEFLNLFWNNKLENILKTEFGEHHLHQYLENSMAGENLEFYMKMRQILQRPYLDKQEFESLKHEFVEIGAEKELNLSSDCRERILSYNENSDLLASGYVKTEALKEATGDITQLMEQQVCWFAEEMLRTEDVAKDLHSVYATSDGIDQHAFQQLLVKNLAFAEFIADVRKLFLKVNSVALQEIQRQLKL